jgi:hypothetical protein
VLRHVLLDRRGTVERRRAEALDRGGVACAGGREHLAAQCPRELHGHVPDAARAALHEHRLAGLEPRPVDDPHVRRDERERQRGGLAHRQVRGLHGEQVGVDRGELRERALQAADAARHAVHLVAGAKRGDIRADRFDDPGQVDAEHRRQRVLRVRSGAGADFRVERIDGACLDAHEHFAARR